MEMQNWPEKYDINKLISIQSDIEKLINGDKTSVRRNDRYADPGDKLELNGHEFVVDDVYPQKLGDVTEEQARDEGYDDLDAYQKGITGIHGGEVWDSNITVWAHELKAA